MIRRRELLAAGLGLAAAATAEYLRPRRKLVLLRGGTIADVVPLNFGGWSSETASGLVSPDQAGKLARTLYSEILERAYHDADTGAEVMVLAAYGDTQSDLLQLHRPESCYPAVGYAIRSTLPANMPISGRAVLPARKVVAAQENRVENIVYWTRVGERLPQSSREQREARFQNAVEGYVTDGILMRCSIVGDTKAAFSILDRFVPSMLTAIDRKKRPAIVGTRLANEMA
jgi:EpsI family protein